MFTVLVIDDESATRNTIKKLIHCFNEEYEVVGEAVNGIQGFELLKETGADIIILDIRMPEMDGISFMNKVRKNNFNCKIIILTAYNDFDYARVALKMSALDYLLKPVGRNDLKKVLDKAASLILKERESFERERVLKSILDKSTGAYRDAVLCQLIDGDNYERIETDIPIIFKDMFTHAAIMLFNIQDRIRNASLLDELRLIVENDLCSLIKGFCFFDKDKRLVFIDLIKAEANTEQLRELTFGHAQIIQYTFFKAKGYHISIGIGESYHDLRSLYKSYSEAIIALEYRFLYSDKTIIPFDVCKYSISEYKYPYKTENYLINSLLLADCDSAIANLNIFFGEILKRNLNPVSLKQICMQLGMTLLKKIRELEISGQMDDIEDSFFFDMSRYETVIEFKTQLTLVIHRIVNFMNESNKLKDECRFKKIIEAYLEKNYSRNIGLSDVAKELGVSSNYFSSLFKKEIGENFVEYLTQYRIEKAKSILNKETLPITKVAEMVGFNDARYFFRVFKKLEGITPKEYCKFLKIEEFQ